MCGFFLDRFLVGLTAFLVVHTRLASPDVGCCESCARTHGRATHSAVTLSPGPAAPGRCRARGPGRGVRSPRRHREHLPSRLAHCRRSIFHFRTSCLLKRKTKPRACRAMRPASGGERATSCIRIDRGRVTYGRVTNDRPTSQSRIRSSRGIASLAPAPTSVSSLTWLHCTFGRVMRI